LRTLRKKYQYHFDSDVVIPGAVGQMPEFPMTEAPWFAPLKSCEFERQEVRRRKKEKKSHCGELA